MDVSAGRPSSENMSVFLYKKLPLDTFLFEFDNLEWAYGRNSCYICFKLKPILATSTTGTTESELWGYVTNKGEVADGIPRESPEKRGMHAEELLLDEMTRHVREHGGVGFCVEWFASWSPCDRCSGVLLRWLRDVGGGRHRLRVWFSRIYRGNVGPVRAGLRHLCRAGVQLGVMDRRRHDNCVHILVDAAQSETTPLWLVQWHSNVPRVQREFDKIMDEKDDNGSDNSDPGKLSETTSGGHESWHDDDWHLPLEDLTGVVECTPSKQGPPEATAAPTLPRKRQQEDPMDALTAKRALF
ncbi:DNA dC-_dU-editing enzyme APOBEC-3G-like [Lethenteron reissneri]|uniref:DNA dC->dU-editing enzyme APOBEC-3G-like n=1 Tax=Lethenteron reissneri TaxID=7753 RepID=UPI002AB78277|nr:DNA dC->dU-editing enzyme APOBEC-3G-like [Lethenteron reissneri]